MNRRKFLRSTVAAATAVALPAAASEMISATKGSYLAESHGEPLNQPPEIWSDKLIKAFKDVDFIACDYSDDDSTVVSIFKDKLKAL